ncbi:MAG: SAM-dependent chlorinase/fluorinase, partial [Terriglobales bacterium]
MTEAPTITLTTDFGAVDGFVGIVKGVIRTIAPAAHLIDLSHEIPSWDIASAAWVIWNAQRYFPEHTV